MRAEQLRLVLEGVAQSVVIGFLVSTIIMVVVLWTLAPHAVLLGWYGVFLAERISAAVFSQRALRVARHLGRDRWTERILVLSKIVEDSILGSLLWIALPLQVPAISILSMFADGGSRASACRSWRRGATSISRSSVSW